MNSELFKAILLGSHSAECSCESNFRLFEGLLSQSPDLNPIQHAFQLLNTRLKAERPTNKHPEGRRGRECTSMDFRYVVCL